MDHLVDLIKLKPPKTVDERYKFAVQTYKEISAHVLNMTGYIEKMKEQISQLSRNAAKFGTDIRDLYKDTPDENQQMKSQTVSLVAHQFSNLTKNFYQVRIDRYVIQPLVAYQNEVSRIGQLRGEVKFSRKNYDKTRNLLDENAKKILEYNQLELDTSKLSTLNPKRLFLNKETIEHETEELTQRFLHEKGIYDRKNEEFISSVQKLLEFRTELAEKPIQDCICIMSQYMMLTFQDFQKLRTSFPEQCFPSLNPDIQETVCGNIDNQ